jgi:hypothetical protein
MPWIFCQARYSIHVPTQCSYEWFGKYLHHIAQEYKIPTFPTKQGAKHWATNYRYYAEHQQQLVIIQY